MRAIRMVLLLAGTLAGCATSPGPRPVAPPPLVGRPLVLMLPFSNLTGRLEEGGRVSNVFYAELARTGSCELVDYGEADRLVQSLRLRDPGAPTSAQVRALCDSTGARFLLVGTVLEATQIQTPEGALPSVGVALRMIDAGSLHAVWALSGFRTGQDRETVFGWGRVTSMTRLVTELAAEMFRTFPAGAAADTGRRTAR